MGGGTQLRQVTAKSAVAAGTFWVDAANTRIYLAGTDVAKGGVEVSDRDVFVTISGAGSALEGLRITRFSNSANDYGVVRVNPGAHGTDAAQRGDHRCGVPGRAVRRQLTAPGRVAGERDGGPVELDGGVVEPGGQPDPAPVLVTELNQFGEFTHAPQSGALKTSRNRAVKVLDSVITNNNSHGLWFDQSNVDVDVVGNTITGNAGSAVFFEISDDLLMVNNYIRSTGGARALRSPARRGSSWSTTPSSAGPTRWGSTSTAGPSPAAPTPANRCAPAPTAPTGTPYAPCPATLDWMPRIDLMINNIIAYPTATGYCGTSTALCITAANGTATAPIQTVIHKADPARGIPQTRIDGNVYANGTSHHHRDRDRQVHHPHRVRHRHGRHPRGHPRDRHQRQDRHHLGQPRRHPHHHPGRRRHPGRPHPHRHQHQPVPRPRHPPLRPPQLNTPTRGHIILGARTLLA